jgi:hypothetical protein
LLGAYLPNGEGLYDSMYFDGVGKLFKGGRVKILSRLQGVDHYLVHGCFPQGIDFSFFGEVAAVFKNSL